MTSVSAELRSATWTAHEDAAGAGVSRRLLEGDLPLPDYVQLSTQLWFVYRALEAAGDAMASDPHAGPFVFEELRRLPALAKDLDSLVGTDWQQRAEMTVATRDYVERIDAVCAEDAAAFVAHHYTRYLGDLSGGQIFAAAARRSYGFAGSFGTRFYDFDDIASLDEFKREYRRLLDEADWTLEQRERLVDEVLRAYEFNTRLLGSVGEVRA